VVAARTARMVLEAVAEAMPRQGGNVVTRVDIVDGWGGLIQVRVHTLLSRDADSELPARLGAAMARSVSGRHRVGVVWASAG
jgi:hypothetical protein